MALWCGGCGSGSNNATYEVGATTPTVLRAISGSVSATPALTSLAPLQVAVQDATGRTVPGATNVVTISLGGGTRSRDLGSPRLLGTLTVTAVDGIATFGNVRVSQAAADLTLLFTSPGLQSAVQGGVTTTALPVDYVGMHALLAGQETQYVEVADFNGDGRPDLVATGLAGNQLVILLANADGSYAAPTSLAAGVTNPWGLAVGDFNGDQRLDIAVVGATSNSVAILLGNGDGTFTAAGSFATGAEPRSVACADVNGDARLDLVIANFTDDSVSVILGQGDGTFVPGATVAVPAGPSRVIAGDFTGDGLVDVALVSNTAGSFSLLQGDGHGGFAAPQTTPTGASPFACRAGDFDGDGRTDFVVSDDADDTVTLVHGNGQPATVLQVGTCLSDLVVGDFNGDHLLDVAVLGSACTPSVFILLGKGDGTFQAPTPYRTLGEGGLACADLDGRRAPGPGLSLPEHRRPPGPEGPG